MNNIFVINTHHPYESSPGRLNAALTECIVTTLREKGYDLRTTRSAEPYIVAEEAEKQMKRFITFVTDWGSPERTSVATARRAVPAPCTWTVSP